MVGVGDAEIRVYDSTTSERQPCRAQTLGQEVLIMTARRPYPSQNGLILDYSAQSRAKLDPDSTSITSCTGRTRSDVEAT